MTRIRCYCCREYGDDPGPLAEYKDEDMVDAKHHDGYFQWGGDMEKAKGRWVKICRWCRDALADEGYPE